MAIIVVFFIALAVIYFFLRKEINRTSIVRINNTVEIYCSKTKLLIGTYDIK